MRKIKNHFNQNDNNDIICIIDSDMFFINEIDIENEIKDKDILYFLKQNTLTHF